METVYCRCCGTNMENNDHCPECFCEEFEETCPTRGYYDRQTGTGPLEHLVNVLDETDLMPLGTRDRERIETALRRAFGLDVERGARVTDGLVARNARAEVIPCATCGGATAYETRLVSATRGSFCSPSCYGLRHEPRVIGDRR